MLPWSLPPTILATLIAFDGTARLWRGSSGTYPSTLRSDRGYERLDITGLTGVTAAQHAALLAPGGPWSSMTPEC